MYEMTRKKRSISGFLTRKKRRISVFLTRRLHDAVLSKRWLRCVRSLQTACGVTPQGSPSNVVLHSLFTVASTLGDEAFYTVALPLCSWVLDLRLSRRLALFWASTYYVGQAAKDLLRLPRPPAPVIRLEQHYSQEYGLPSTHTMGSLIPLFLVACHFGPVSASASGFSFDTIPRRLLGSCFCWSGAIALSRLYMGAWAFVLVGAVAAILCYPRPERWTNSYGDTTLIVATAAGFLVACCCIQQQHQYGKWGHHTRTTLEVLADVHLVSSGRFESYNSAALLGDVRRCGVGFMVLLPMRFALKSACRGLLSALLRLACGSGGSGASSSGGRIWRLIGTEAGRRHFVDIPSKVVVYGSMGFSSCFLIPQLWLWLGLEADS